MKKLLLLLLVGVVLFGCLGSNAAVPQTGNITGKVVSSASSDPITSQGPVKEFTMVAKQWAFEPDTITVKKGDHVKLTISDIDVAHGFGLPDFNVDVFLTPGTKTIVEFDADKVGTFTFFCSVRCGRGHRDMKGQLIISD